MKNKIISSSLLVTGFLLGATALSALAGVWTPPQSTPPADNVPAPINVGVQGINALQEKFDSLMIDGSLGVIGNLVIATGTPSAGDVLTAVDGLGTVTWSPVSGGGTVINSSAIYFDQQSTQTSVVLTSWADTGISLTVTPGTASSKFLMNANISAIVTSGSGNCSVGLFKDGTLLSTVPGASAGAGTVSSSNQFLDSATDTTSRVYSVKAKMDSSGRECRISGNLSVIEGK